MPEAMTRRELMESVLNGIQPERTPVCIRLNLWYNDCKSRGALADEIRDLTCSEIEDYLGFVRSSRYLMQPALKFRSLPIEIREPGDGEKTEAYVLPGKTLTRRTRRTADMIRQGMQAHALAYPLTAEEDYDVLLECMEDAYLDFRIADFEDFDRQVGDAGLPMAVSVACPLHMLMLDFVGYENFFYHLADFPGKVEELTERMEAVFRRDLWPALCNSEAWLVLHGVHFSSQITPPKLFERYFMPYFKAFNARMHEHGKKAVWHADAEMGALLEHVLAAGFDMADCLLSAPAAPQSIRDYFDAWQGKIVCWGGLPSMVFDDSYPLSDFENHVRGLADLAENRCDFIFGASDHVMPGASWDRLVRLA